MLWATLISFIRLPSFRANETHKYFIDALKEALQALGGASWEPDDTSAVEREARDGVEFQNKFSALSLGKAGIVEGEDDDGNDSEADSGQIVRTGPRKQPRPGKGKKGKTQADEDEDEAEGELRTNRSDDDVDLNLRACSPGTGCSTRPHRDTDYRAAYRG